MGSKCMIVLADKKEGNVMFDINVKKGQLREFLKFCIDLANVDDDEEVFRELELTAKRRMFGVVFYEGEDVDVSHAMNFMVDELKDFKCSLRLLVHFIAKEKPFFIDFESTGKTFSIFESPALGPMIGFKKTLLKFYRSPEEEESCWQDQWFNLFWDHLLRYAKARNESILDSNLGVCPECDNVYLGRRKGQIFCKKEHGHRWRAREAYRKMASIKKGENDFA